MGGCRTAINSSGHPDKLKRSDWAWPFGSVIIAFIISISFLVHAGHLSLERLVVGENGVSVLFGEGSAKNLKKQLADVIQKEASGKVTKEVGLFLHINQRQYIDGRTARNIGEICFALRFSKKPSPNLEIECPPEDYAQIQFSLHELKRLNFRQDVRYARSSHESYELNTLGQQAFEGLWERLLLEDDEWVKSLAYMDLSYPGLGSKIEMARNWPPAQ
ncbi:MAG: hypothetical protein HQL36_02550 [Alphaproteobacteria bacterium]|nr:hypothetical protein [Alphaproteobacteria bacterium]